MANVWHALVDGNLVRGPAARHAVVDMLRRCEVDPLMICSVARLYWTDRRVENACESFDRAVSVGPDLDVIVRCQAAEPSRGETWQSIVEADKNGRKLAKEILELVAAALKILSCSMLEYVLFWNHITAI
jgi:pre-mRNA-processing factor 6